MDQEDIMRFALKSKENYSLENHDLIRMRRWMLNRCISIYISRVVS